MSSDLDVRIICMLPKTVSRAHDQSSILAGTPLTIKAALDPAQYNRQWVHCRGRWHILGVALGVGHGSVRQGLKSRKRLLLFITAIG